MTKLDYGHALIALLGLGATDLAALNLWALPGVLTVTDAQAASDALQPVAAAVTAPPPPAAIVSPPEVEEVVAEASAVIPFGHGSWSIGRQARATLRDLLAGVASERVQVEIDGHADATGPESLNDRISEARAKAVAAELRRLGLAADHMQVRAFGERIPSPDGQSRRVEIRVRGEP
jgi:outer membrane protein OmpA-like peptidoglycan-associated protein